MGAGHWRPGGLLGSPFNVKWRFSAPAGDVEESKLSPVGNSLQKKLGFFVKKK
jgi:hypothetical protein